MDNHANQPLAFASSSQTESSCPSCPSLPNEVISHIITIGYPDEADLVFLWTTVRNINHTFRAAVEYYVSRHHLKRTWLVYQRSASWRAADLYGLDPTNASSKTELWHSFAGLMQGEENTKPGTARFKYDDEMSKLRSGQGLHLSQSVGKVTMLEEALQRHPLDDWVAPAHMLVIERFVNDTEAVGFELRRFEWPSPWRDPDEEGEEERARRLEREENYEIRIDWRETFTSLLMEEKSRQAMSKAWMISQKKPQTLTPTRLTPNPNHSTTDDYAPLRPLHERLALHLHKSNNNRDESFARARVQRIQRLCRERKEEKKKEDDGSFPTPEICELMRQQDIFLQQFGFGGVPRAGEPGETIPSGEWEASGGSEGRKGREVTRGERRAREKLEVLEEAVGFMNQFCF